MRALTWIPLLASASQWPIASAASVPFSRMRLGARDYNAFPYNPGFPIQKVIALAVNISSHSWEFGTATEALLELYNPELSIFGDDPFTAAQSLSPDDLPQGLAYAAEKITIGTGPNALADGDGAVGDPASLGVAAVMLGNLDGYEQFGNAATAEYQYVTQGAPRAWNGAISHRVDYVELWADFIYMAPPFLAYYAVATSNFTLLREAVYQCEAYHQILAYNATAPAYAFDGLWEHILGPVNNDPGLWSTGNAWAAAGMTRVLATVIKAPDFSPTDADVDAQTISSWRGTAISTLTAIIKDIVDAAIDSAPGSYEDGLIRNYYDNPTIFGETSGSSMLAATVYRLAVLDPDTFGDDRYIDFAEGIRKVLGCSFTYNGTSLTHVDATNGTVRPAVNPLGWGDVNPWMTGSPEGQSMVTMLYAGWRDCILAGQC
ncbi:hypothetical protein H0H92_005700 [Tricholoma furcatifolium]|nr:hypothetical protein H0H92_005700 [Tricholoma furcatifolium]